MDKNKDYCFWSVGDGECAFILQALVDSFHRVGMQADFHAFSDRPIEGATTHLIEKLDTRGFLFKFQFLQTEMKHWDYRYFIYLDSDNVFVRHPGDLLKVMHQAPLHFSLEHDCTLPSKRKAWWNCPLEDYVKMMRECGITSEHIYTINGGFFIIQKEVIDVACGLALDFWEYALSLGHQFPDEPAWAYAMQMLCDDPKKHLLSHSWDLWCSDWEGIFSKQLPNGKEWTFREYMTDAPHQVNPAIVHALRSKALLIKMGQHSKKL